MQDRARAWIDLNRAEDERDPRVDEGAPLEARAAGRAETAQRAGPDPAPRGQRANDLWKRRFTAQRSRRGSPTDHRPYHAALAADTGGRARAVRDRGPARHPLDAAARTSGARIVIGDRFGRSAAARFVARMEARGRRPAAPRSIRLMRAGISSNAMPIPRAASTGCSWNSTGRFTSTPRFDRPGAGFAATARDAAADDRGAGGRGAGRVAGAGGGDRPRRHRRCAGRPRTKKPPDVSTGRPRFREGQAESLPDTARERGDTARARLIIGNARFGFKPDAIFYATAPAHRPRRHPRQHIVAQHEMVPQRRRDMHDQQRDHRPAQQFVRFMPEIRPHPTRPADTARRTGRTIRAAAAWAPTPSSSRSAASPA